MLTIQEYIPVTQAKSKLLDIIRKLESSDDTYAITKNGVPEAVLISIKKYENRLRRHKRANGSISRRFLRNDDLEDAFNRGSVRAHIQTSSGSQKAN